MLTVHVWEGCCYDKGLKGFIVPDAFAHPAKYSLGLIERIFDYSLERGYLKRGDVVGDAFGGVAIGGLVAAYRGLRWYGVELEPKFVGLCRANIKLHRSKLECLGFPLPVIMQGDSRKFHEHVQASGIVSSPPYADTTRGNNACGIDWEKAAPKLKTSGRHQAPGASASTEYGNTPGQIGSLRSGDIAGVISSPPFTTDQPCASQTRMKKDYHAFTRGDGTKRDHQMQTEGNIQSLKPGDVSAVISSPPYAVIAAGAGGLNTKPAKHAGQQSGRQASAASQDTDQRYGQSDGQISQLKGGSVEAVVSSPPWEDQEGAMKGSKFKFLPHHGKGKGHAFSDKARAAELVRAESHDYGTTEGQIGKSTGETYWQAMAQVYASCYLAIKPGGYIVLVVKDYVKGGKRVPLCDDTCRLLEHVGFQMVERIHAMLVKETRHEDLFNGHTVQTKSRKSFFRRLAEKNGSPKIDFEEVLIARKPLTT